MPKAIRKYTELRARLMRRGLSVRACAIQIGVPVGSAYNAVNGLRNGPRSRDIQRQIEDIANG